MGNVCPHCGKPIQPGMKFCAGCGANLSEGTAKARTVSANMASMDVPQGADWIAVGLTALSLFYVATLSLAINVVLGVIILGCIAYKWRLVKEALWHKNIFKPFIVHFVWGFFIILMMISALQDASRSMGGLVQLLLILALLVANGVYYVGFRIICKFYPESKPQGRLVQFLVSIGVIMLYFMARRDQNGLNSFFGADNAGAAPDMTQAAAGAGATGVAAGMGTIDPSGAANIPDPSAASMNASVDPSSAASGAAQSSTFNMTDSMSQQAGSATFNGDGSADFTNADMSYAGHMFSDGSLLNSLNIPDGHIDFANGTGTIYDNLNNAIFTIDGNTIYDANHQVAYTMQNGTLFDKMNQAVGTIHKA